MNHLIETLKAYNLSEHEIHQLISRINTYSDDVTGASLVAD